MVPHRNIHKYTWTYLDGKTHNQMDYVLINKRWHSSSYDIRHFGGVDCDTDHYLVVAKVRKGLSMSKRVVQCLIRGDLISRI